MRTGGVSGQALIFVQREDSRVLDIAERGRIEVEVKNDVVKATL